MALLGLHRRVKNTQDFQPTPVKACTISTWCFDLPQDFGLLQGAFLYCAIIRSSTAVDSRENQSLCNRRGLQGCMCSFGIEANYGRSCMFMRINSSSAATQLWAAYSQVRIVWIWCCNSPGQGDLELLDLETLRAGAQDLQCRIGPGQRQLFYARCLVGQK